MTKRPQLLLAVGEPLSLAALLAFLLWRTWLRWPEPLIDFPREPYTAWRLSEGALLYADVMSWYGPLSHLVAGAAFKIFGPGLDTLVWLNIAVTAAVTFLFRGVFGLLGGRLLGWLAAVIFLLVFAFGQFGATSIFNFIAPYASQAPEGLAGLLLMLWALLRHAQTPHRRWLLLAGAGLAIAYLNKIEPMLAAAGSLAVYLLLRWLRRSRRAAGVRESGLGWDVLLLLAGFLCLWVPVFLILAAQGGVEYAAAAANQVPHSLFDSAGNRSVLLSPINRGTFGLDEPWENFSAEAWAGGLLVAICAVLLLGGWAWSRARKFRFTWWASLLAVAAIGLAVAWRVNWINFGLALIFPTLLAALAAFVLALRAMRRGGPDCAHIVSLATVGVAGALMLTRILLHGNIYYFGFYQAPLAVLFLLLLLAVEAPRRLGSSSQPNRLLQAVFVSVALFAALSLGRIALGNYALKTYPVGEGRDRFYTYDPDLLPGGALLNAMMSVVKKSAPAARTLLAFPETAAVNYYLRRPAPVPQLDYNPGGLAFTGSARVLADLTAHPPDVILLYPRDLHEYGAPYFGYDDKSGRTIVDWMNQNYRLCSVARHAGGPASYILTGDAVDLYTRSAPPGS